MTFSVMWQTMSAGKSGQSCSIGFPAISLFAQEAAEPMLISPPAPEQPADSPAVLYQVMGVILVVWLGLGLFLFLINRRVTRLEKNLPDSRGKDS